MRIAGTLEKVSALVVIGVTESGLRQVILGLMDGLAGLRKVFREEFPQGKVQRCQVHIMRDVLAKVPQKLKQGSFLILWSR